MPSIEKQRIFVAVNLPQEVKNELWGLQERIKEEFKNLGGVDPQKIIRFTLPENLHLTLLFLGYISPEQTEALKRILKETAAKYPSFYLTLKNTRYAPPGMKIPRMIWAEIEKNNELIFLHNNLKKAVMGTREFRYFQPEKRAFAPHLTLARLRLFGLKSIATDELPDVEQELDLSFKVQSVEIMQSTLKRTGAEYKIISSCFLHPVK